MRAATLASLLTLAALSGPAVEVVNVPATTKAAPGHSVSGEAFNEGPRQKADLMTGTGAVHFPISTSRELAQRFFDQGLGQLHGFWYFEAERSFRQVAALEPGCAMAYWGMAMANVNNGKRARSFIQEAVARLAQASAREQGWINAYNAYIAESKTTDRERRLALVKSLERLSFDYPEDVEAKAFLLLQLWDNEEKGIPLGSHQAVEALGKEILAMNPLHPVHHYLIHLWNSEDDRRALASAALCGQVAPGIAHMWHMPGHTFSKLHRFADAAWQQEASARVDHQYMMTARILPEQIHNYAHNNNWLAEDLERIGRAHDAVALAKNMIELPRLAPSALAMGSTGHNEARTGYSMGRERLLETAGRYELWDELLSLEETPYLAPSEDPTQEVARLAALGTAAYARRNLPQGEMKLNLLEAEQRKLQLLRLRAVEDAETQARSEKKTPEAQSAAMAAALLKTSARVEATNWAVAEVRLAQAIATRRPDEARTQLDLAKSLAKTQRAQAWLQIGDLEEAQKAAAEAVQEGAGEVLPLATQAAVLWQAGQKEKALAAFRRLLPLAAQVDLDVPALARLAPLAKELQLPEDWRPPLAWGADSGQRPDLAKLGPFRWQPSPAPMWNLADQNGQRLSLENFRGRPVLVVFYLGSGCPRCIEQLNVLAPVTKDFAAAGITIIAVSADRPEALHETFASAKAGRSFTFPILADPELEAFKAYRAFDDFENTPLHGVFLIDGTGLIRWQDISFEAFTDAKWLLGESRRLLGLPTDLTLRQGPGAGAMMSGRH